MKFRRTDGYFALSIDFKKIKYQDKSDSQKLEYYLSTLWNYIKITESEITVTLIWDDLWTQHIEQLLKPIEGITFDIWLVFSDNNWKNFSEAFNKIFPIINEIGSKITNIHFKKESFGSIEFSEEATCLLEQLRSFEI